MPTTAHKMLHLLSGDDWNTFCRFVPNLREPDLVIAPDGEPYLYRWHIIPRNSEANVYFHVQVADDPERPLHDHPWDNTSVILAGGYLETLQQTGMPERVYRREKGQVIHRRAEWPHHLRLAPGKRYAMTLFSTGPKVRDWGFWVPGPDARPIWFKWTDLVEMRGDRSLYHAPTPAQWAAQLETI